MRRRDMAERIALNLTPALCRGALISCGAYGIAHNRRSSSFFVRVGREHVLAQMHHDIGGAELTHTTRQSSNVRTCWTCAAIAGIRASAAPSWSSALIRRVLSGPPTRDTARRTPSARRPSPPRAHLRPNARQGTVSTAICPMSFTSRFPSVVVISLFQIVFAVGEVDGL
jgi:hypothetical protein